MPYTPFPYHVRAEPPQPACSSCRDTYFRKAQARPSSPAGSGQHACHARHSRFPTKAQAAARHRARPTWVVGCVRVVRLGDGPVPVRVHLRVDRRRDPVPRRAGVRHCAPAVALPRRHGRGRMRSSSQDLAETSLAPYRPTDQGIFIAHLLKRAARLTDRSFGACLAPPSRGVLAGSSREQRAANTPRCQHRHVPCAWRGCCARPRAARTWSWCCPRRGSRRPCARSGGVPAALSGTFFPSDMHGRACTEGTPRGQWAGMPGVAAAGEPAGVSGAGCAWVQVQPIG